MSSKRLFTVLAASVLGLTSSAALAGFTAVLGPVEVTNSGGSPATLTVTSPGTIVSYVPQTPADPQLTGNDLNHFKLTFTSATFTAPTPGSIVGTYYLYYDLGLDGQDAGDPRISSGTFSFNAGALNSDGAYPLDGTITQILGPSNPALADLSYGQPNNPLSFTGFYNPGGATPNISGVIVQGLAIPEPASMSLLGLPVLALAARRRRA